MERWTGKPLAEVTRAFSTRRVPDEALVDLDPRDSSPPRAGDLVLARVDSLGQHTRLQRPSGRRKVLFPGDPIIVAFGNRYAPRQFEAVVPPDLGPCQLVAAGGLAAKALSWHERVVKGPTQISPYGFVVDASGRRVNLADHALPPSAGPRTARPPTLVSLGTSMNSGKTTTAAFLVRGLTRAGLRVGFAKLTGTGAGNDLWMLGDAGADPVLDFTDAGHASTYLLEHAVIEEITARLVAHLRGEEVDVILLEVADGLLQRETAELLRCALFKRLVDAALFASPDALGASAGVEILRREGLRVLGVSGALAAAPLQRREVVSATGLPVFGRGELADPVTSLKLLEEARA